MNVGKKVAQFTAAVRASGLQVAAAKAAKHVQFLLGSRHRYGDPTYQRRVALYEGLNQRLNGIVGYGPFAGMRLPRETSWAGPDRSSMLLGMYEQEVVAKIASYQCGSGVFIDLGAADGFYGVGVLLAGWFDTSYCYEMSEIGQKTLLRNAYENGVGDKVVVRGLASEKFYREIPAEQLAGTVVLIDIEGGEFDLLTAATLEALRRATIIIEVHPWVDGGEERLALLRSRAQATHDVSSFKTGARDPSQFEELSGYNDTDRWLICSEDRPMLMTWLVLDRR